MNNILDQIGDKIIPIIIFMVPIAIVWITSYFGHKRTEMIHRERLAAIERGIMPAGELPEAESAWHRKREPGPAPNYLRRGLFWLCPGGALVVFSMTSMTEAPAGVRLPILGVSVICAGIGAAYVAIHLIDEKQREIPHQ